MHTGNFDEVLELILAKDSRYHRDAYVFLREALDYTQKLLAKGNRETREGLGESSEEEAARASASAGAKSGKEEAVRHVTGHELLDGIRAFALEQFGPMTITVMDEWGIRRGEDFGEIVFSMVDNHLLAKTKNDSRDHFKGGYEFDDAFRQPFLPPSQQKSPCPAQRAVKASKT